jgi:hypothetical protein
MTINEQTELNTGEGLRAEVNDVKITFIRQHFKNGRWHNEGEYNDMKSAESGIDMTLKYSKLNHIKSVRIQRRTVATHEIRETIIRRSAE